MRILGFIVLIILIVISMWLLIQVRFKGED
jgi:hypothetical protein